MRINNGQERNSALHRHNNDQVAAHLQPASIWRMRVVWLRLQNCASEMAQLCWSESPSTMPWSPFAGAAVSHRGQSCSIFGSRDRHRLFGQVQSATWSTPSMEGGR